MKKLSFLLSLFVGTLFAGSSNTITFVTRNAPTTYYIDARNQPAGFEYDLMKAFAEARHYHLKIIVEDSVQGVLQAMRRHKAQIAAAGLTQTKTRDEKLLPGPPYLTVEEKVVCRSGLHPKKITDLIPLNLEIIAQSSYLETLQKLKKSYPKLHWKEHKGYTTEHIFERMERKLVDCTLADSNIVDLNWRYFPHLNVPFTIGPRHHLVWYFPKNREGEKLQKEVREWFKRFRSTPAFKTIKERYFGHIVKFDYVDIARYHKRILKRLPKFLPYFRQSSRKYGIDWRILAAQAYQESHWDPKAKSPTGVRGIMMLTRPTAKELGVINRLDPQESIEGGAKYLSRLFKRIPKSVKDPIDRYRFALAAYNIGMGHLYDAIRLGKSLGIDPYHWYTMKKLLPKLAMREYYKKLRYGYARGTEPVRYVTRIKNYYDILVKYYPKK